MWKQTINWTCETKAQKYEYMKKGLKQKYYMWKKKKQKQIKQN